jgi:hypothetical protein
VQSSEERTPRVHFPPSPVLVTSTFAAHSADVYDRGAISVSPNPLEIPAWGDRIYSPSIDGFRAKSPTDSATFKASFGSARKELIPSPALLSPASPIIAASIYGEPGADSPEAPPLEIPEKAATKAGAKFREKIAAQMEKVHEPSNGPGVGAGASLGMSLTKYPRSPYPSAPVSPVQPSPLDDSDIVTPTAEGMTPKRSASVHGDSPVKVSRLSAGLKLDERTRAPSPLQHSFIAASPPFARTEDGPRDIVMTRERGESITSPGLRQAFWKSLSIEEIDGPVSADIKFGGADGALWSPASIPVAADSGATDDIKPLAKPGGVLMRDRKRSKAMSPPPPDDPFAAFPSFAAVISMGMGAGGDIAYPPRALTMADLPEDVVEDD